MERRLHQRNQVHFEVRVTDLTTRAQACLGRVSDISKSGISVILPIRFATGDLVQLEMADSILAGRVVYSNPEETLFRIGIEVDRIHLGDSDLSNLLQRTLMDAMSGVPGLEPSETRLG